MGKPSPRGAVDQADAAVSYAETLLAAYGAVDVVDGAVKAGDVTLNDHTELVDAVKDKYGFGCTIFQANIRIATTAVAAGGTDRALGTSTNEIITQQVFRSGMRFRGITRTIGKDWVIVYVPLRDHSNRIIGMIAAYRELTEYLDDLELLDGAPEGVLLHTPDGRLCDVNRAACDMLGMSKRELLQKSIQEFTVGTSHLDGKRTWDTGSEPITVESRWHRADGHEFPVELSVGPATSTPASTLLTIARDFTERFAARERLRALNVELSELNHSLEDKVAERTRDLVVARDAALQASSALEAKVEERTAELRREIFERRSAENEATKANRAKSEFLSSMSHELRTPLNAILGFAQMLRDFSDTRLSEEQITFVEQILDGGQHLLGLVNDILDLSRIEAGRLDLSLEPIDPAQAVRESLALVRPLADTHGIAIVVGADIAQGTLVTADPGRLKQVLLNVLSNAVKYNRDNGTVTVRSAATDTGMMRISVSDTGPGIPAEKHDEVFRAFSRLGAEASKVEGTGIGLTISRELIESMGGRLDFDSTVGEGSTFWIEVPIAEPKPSSSGDA